MPFKPKYTITDKILNNLTLIASAREVIEQSYLVPKREASLRRQALLHNTHSSTAIEGNKLTLEQVGSLAAGKNVVATSKDKQEVLNYIEALKKVPELTEKGKIKTQDLLNIHSIITRKTLQRNDYSGKFRSIQVFVGRRVFEGTGFKTEVEYMPPKPESVTGLVNDFLKWLNRNKAWGLDPVLLAGIVHYEIARIHPFVDGNGRTARLFATLILYLNGFDHRRLFALDDYYDRDRKAYYAALKTAQISDGDLTRWLEYFTMGVAYSVTEVKEAILKLGSKKDREGRRQIPLTERQMRIVEHISIHGRVANKDLQAIFNISAQAVHKELVKLVDLKVVKSVGEGRALHYVLV